MGRGRAALAVLVTAWLGLAAMTFGGGAPERIEVSSAPDAVVVPVGSVLSEVVVPTPELRFDGWSKRADALRLPLAVALAMVLVEAVRAGWRHRALVPLEARHAWVAPAAAPRGPPA
jgi:hypothetical protein